MRRISSLAFAFSILTAFGLQAASAQITIKIPDMPRVKKPKAEPPRTGGGGNAPASYQHFDKEEFNSIKWGNTQYLDPYLECYAKKHNLELIKVTGHAFSAPRYKNAKEMKQALQAELPKLAEIESQLKSKLRSRPNTSLNYHENPAIWEEITSNRDEYMKCAVGEKESLRVSESVWLRAHLEEIVKKQKEVDEYNPTDKLYMVSATTYDYLLFAVSPRARDKWLKGANAEEFKPNLDPALDVLAAAAAKKLPTYIPNAANFTFHNLLEERMMKTQAGDLAALKIHKIGLAQSNWQISKNDIGLPTARYKQGYMWVRNTTDDHPYCHLYQINIIQDYAGGGTYAASYARYIDSTLMGCPTAAR